jgi:hypothetical protein
LARESGFGDFKSKTTKTGTGNKNGQ